MICNIKYWCPRDKSDTPLCCRIRGKHLDPQSSHSLITPPKNLSLELGNLSGHKGTSVITKNEDPCCQSWVSQVRCQSTSETMLCLLCLWRNYSTSSFFSFRIIPFRSLFFNFHSCSIAFSGNYCEVNPAKAY